METINTLNDILHGDEDYIECACNQDDCVCSMLDDEMREAQFEWYFEEWHSKT